MNRPQKSGAERGEVEIMEILVIAAGMLPMATRSALSLPFQASSSVFWLGLTGVGGGSLMTPLLMLVFGIQATTAVGTDLLYAAVTKSGGTLVHYRRGTMDWQVTRRLALHSWRELLRASWQ
jgi:hypothetical protein